MTRGERESTLTPQEVTVMELFWRGLSIKEAAEQMKLSHRTVGHYRNNIFQKLNVHNKVEMVWEGLRRGLLKAPNGSEYPG